ncbi:MAG TPA: uroporphyrinogen-III synthase [Candidatus Acidoferrales bacterium]|nr:uroporphyrinogen-III synthase [Candidatus Acidoferrales bacterium]
MESNGTLAHNTSPGNALSGKRIVITRAPGQGEDLRAELRLAGAHVIELPCVEFRELQETNDLDQAIGTLGDYAWLLFTSQNAARFFARRARALGFDLAKLPKQHPRVAAIGPATAEAARAEGFPVDFVPDAGTGRSFAGNFKDCVRSVAGMEVKNPVVGFVRGTAGMKVLLPRSDLALRDRGAADWMEVLRDAGAEVTAVAAYRTCMPESLAGSHLERIRRERTDCFIFASPSAFENFAKSIGLDDLRRFASTSAFAAIGPTTASAIRAAGVRCAIESTEPNAKSLTNAIAKYFSSAPRESSQPGVRPA